MPRKITSNKSAHPERQNKEDKSDVKGTKVASKSEKSKQGVVKIKTIMKNVKATDRSQSSPSVQSSSYSSNKRRKTHEDEEEYQEECVLNDDEEDLEDITVIKENDSDSEPQKTDIDYEMKRQKQINRRGDFNSYYLSDYYNSTPDKDRSHEKSQRKYVNIYEYSDPEKLRPRMLEIIKSTSVKYATEDAIRCLANNCYAFMAQIMRRLEEKARISNMSLHLTAQNPQPNQLSIIRYQTPNVIYHYNPILLTI